MKDPVYCQVVSLEISNTKHDLIYTDFHPQKANNYLFVDRFCKISVPE